jgi:hypothetical protein
MKEENKNIEESSIFERKSYIEKGIIGICILGFLIVGAYYIWGDQFKISNKIFTEYGPLDYDSTYLNPDSLKSIDSLHKKSSHNDSSIFNQDSIADFSKIERKDTLISENLDTTLEEKMNLFHVNTNYEKISNLSAFKDREGKDDKADTDLFSDLLLPNEVDRSAIAEVFESNSLSYLDILKVLSIAGQDVLIAKDNTTCQTILNALAESEAVKDIYILDRKGNINYTTHTLNVNSSVMSIMEEIRIKEQSIKISFKGDLTVISMPIYHTYGHIGTAVLLLFNNR